MRLRPGLRTRIAASVCAHLALFGAPARSATPSSSTIAQLRAAFVAARQLPPGSRPHPPALDPRRLVHRSWATLRAQLGAYSPCSYDDLFAVPVERCVYFVYGPAPEPMTSDPDGTITISTGGPWLLVLGLRGDRVAEARWLGQK